MDVRGGRGRRKGEGKAAGSKEMGHHKQIQRQKYKASLRTAWRNCTKAANRS